MPFLKADYKIIKNKLIEKFSNNRLSYFILILIMLVILFVIIRVSSKFFDYILSIELLNMFLISKFISFILYIFFFMLVISSCITSIAVFYLNEYETIIMSYPLKRNYIFRDNYIKTFFLSGWMPALVLIPVTMVYYYKLDLNLVRTIFFIAGYTVYSSIAVSIGIFIMHLVFFVVPVKYKNILALLSLIFLVIILFLFRQLRPEQFLKPETFPNLIGYFRNFNIPGFDMSPAHWLYTITLAPDSPPSVNKLNQILLMLSSAVFFYIITKRLFYMLRYNIQSKMNTVFNTGYKKPGHLINYINKHYIIVKKEFLLIFRDTVKLPQFLVVLAVIAIYIYNFKLFSFEEIHFSIRFILVILNCFLAVFVVLTLCARFVLPNYAKDKKYEWFIISSSYPNQRAYKYKYGIFGFFAVVISFLLTFFSNRYIHLPLKTNLIISFINVAASVFIVFYALLNSVKNRDSIQEDTTGLGIWTLLFMLKTTFIIIFYYFFLSHFIFSAVFQNLKPDIKNILSFLGGLSFLTAGLFIVYNRTKIVLTQM